MVARILKLPPQSGCLNNNSTVREFYVNGIAPLIRRLASRLSGEKGICVQLKIIYEAHRCRKCFGSD